MELNINIVELKEEKQMTIQNFIKECYENALQYPNDYEMRKKFWDEAMGVISFARRTGNWTLDDEDWWTIDMGGTFQHIVW